MLPQVPQPRVLAEHHHWRSVPQGSARISPVRRRCGSEMGIECVGLPFLVAVGGALDAGNRGQTLGYPYKSSRASSAGEQRVMVTRNPLVSHSDGGDDLNEWIAVSR